MRALLSWFCWSGCISRRGWLFHSLVATALFLSGFHLTPDTLGGVLDVPAGLVLTYASIIAFLFCPFATLGMLVLLGNEITGSFGNYSAAGETWGLLCGIFALLLMLASALRLLALAVRRRRDAGAPFWPLLLAGGAGLLMIYVLPAFCGLFLALGIQLCCLLLPPSHAQEGAVAPEPPEHEPEERVGEQGEGQPGVGGEENR